MRYLFILSLALLLFSCNDGSEIIPSGNIVEETRTIPSFTEIEVSNGISLYVSQEANNDIIIETDDNIIQYVETYTEGEKLYIKIEDGVDIKPSEDDRYIKVNISTTTISSLLSSGGSKIEFLTPFQASELELAASGGPTISGELDIDKFTCDISGGGKVQLSGICQQMYISASGGSKLLLYEMPTDDSKIEISGGTTAELNINNTLSVNASGGSKIYLKGNAEITGQILDGGSEIIRK